MNKLLLAFTTTIFITPAFTQLSLRTNDKLVYEVNAGGSEYDFTIKIKSLKPQFDFVWQMTNENGNYGRVKVAASALASSYKMNNYFSQGNLQLTNATAVLLSKAAYNDIIKKKRVGLSDGNRKFVFENPDETDYEYTVGGETKSVKAIYLSDGNRNDIVVLKNPEYPLILRMNIGFTITLKTFVPASMSTVDLSGFIGMNTTESGILWDKLNHSSLILTEDLSDIGRKGSSIYKNYHAHIEGLWVKTHNDTITDIIYYPSALSHSEHIYYGGDITIKQLPSLSYNRSQAKTFVKAPFLSRSSYDTDIYRTKPGTTMEIYYHLPASGPDGPEFGMTGDKTPHVKQKVGFVSFQKE